MLQGAVLMLRAGNAANFSKLEVFSLIVAAAVHDLLRACRGVQQSGLGTCCASLEGQAAP